MSNWHGKYFTLQELTNSATAKRHNINNTPTEKIISNLQALVDNVLDPLRMHWGRPIVVTSGYRCPKLNKVVNGSSTSQHILGQAADIRTVSDYPDENKKLLKLLLDLNLPFDQVISEYPDDKGQPNWIHVSYSPAPRKSKLTCKNGKYIKGIVV